MNLRFTILHSPYTDIMVTIDNQFTILDFKNLILEKYNSQQKGYMLIDDKHSDFEDLKQLSLFKDFDFPVRKIEIYGKPYVLSDANILKKYNNANHLLNDDNTIICEFMKEYGNYYLYVRNSYIYERLTRIIRQPKIFGVSEAEFTYFVYIDNLREKTFIKRVEILQFEILRLNEDYTITIKLIKPRNLNYCKGDSNQKYYRLLSNGGVLLYKTVDGIENHLSNELCETFDNIVCHYQFLQICSRCDKKSCIVMGDFDCVRCQMGV